MKTLFPRHLEVSAAVMDLQLERQNLVSSNIANLNTPGYQPRRLEFEKALQAALGRDTLPAPFVPARSAASCGNSTPAWFPAPTASIWTRKWPS
jgi:flagellar basal-body rod protein FlgB